MRWINVFENNKWDTYYPVYPLFFFFPPTLFSLGNLERIMLENPHGQRNLAGYSPWGCKESDMTEWLSTHTYGQMTSLPISLHSLQLSSIQSLSRVWLFATPWITARQASLSITNSLSLPKPMSIESVMPSSHLILCRPLLLLPPIPPSIRVFSNESTLRMRWTKYWSFSFNISPSNEHPGLISFRIDLLAVQGTLKVFSKTTVQKHQFFGIQLSS